MYYAQGAILHTPNIAYTYELRAYRLGEATCSILGTIERSKRATEKISAQPPSRIQCELRLGGKERGRTHGKIRRLRVS